MTHCRQLWKHFSICCTLVFGYHRWDFNDSGAVRVAARFPRPVRMDGCHIGERRCLSSGAACGGALHDRSGKLYGCAGAWKVRHFHYYDHFLCAAVSCLAAAVSGCRTRWFNGGGVRSGGTAHCPVPDAAESVAARRMRRSRGGFTGTFRLRFYQGLLVIVLFYQAAKKHQDRAFRWMWLTIVLSFAFYIPVVLWADVVPAVGMLMIPKTCAYVWAVLMGYFAMKQECR